MSSDRIGLLVRIYMNNGTIFQGAIRQWSNENGVILASPSGEVIEIYRIKDICATVYMEKSGAPIKEKSQEEAKPTHNPGDVVSAIELYKMKAESEREIAKTKLKSPICVSGEIEYGSSISVLSKLANNPGRQNKNKKE